MTRFDCHLIVSSASTESRTRALARVYATILSWERPKKTDDESTGVDINEEVDLYDKTPAFADEKPPTCPAPQHVAKNKSISGDPQ